MLNAQYKTAAAAPDLRVRGTGACSLAGAGMAILMRNRDNPPRVRYSWENEAETIDVEELGDVPARDGDVRPPVTIH